MWQYCSQSRVSIFVGDSLAPICIYFYDALTPTTLTWRRKDPGYQQPWNNIPAGAPKWLTHDDVIKWKHLPRYWPFVRGIHRSPVNSPHKGQWRRALMFSLVCVWINGRINNREAGDLKCHCAHYDVTVKCICVDNNDLQGICNTYIDTQGTAIFRGISSAILNDVIRSIIMRHNHFYNLRNLSNFSVSTVLNDGLAPFGARPSVSTVMNKFGSRIYMGPTL